MRKPEIKSNPAPAAVSAATEARPRIPVWLMAGLLGLVTIALYWPATRCDFVNYDDYNYVTAEAHLPKGLTWENLRWAFFEPEVQYGYWLPMTLLSHMVDFQLFGLQPWGHHLTSVLLHALNTALVFLLLRCLTGTFWRSVVVAALFGWHPLHVESVAWVAERKDVLSALFGLLTLLCYARYAQERKHPTANCQPRIANARGWYWLALAAFALGLMSKPMLVTLPFVLLLLDYWPLKRISNFQFPISKPNHWRLAIGDWQWLVCEKLPFFALAAVTSVVTSPWGWSSLVASRQGGDLEEGVGLPFGARMANALISYCRYLVKLFWPTDLVVFYPHPGYWPLGQVLLAGVLLAGISALFFAMRRRGPFVLMGWLWFVGTLVPVIGLVRVGIHAMADRYTYVPSVGVLILTVWGAYELTRRWRYQVIMALLAGSVTIGFCLVLTRQQLGYWRNSETLWTHALAGPSGNWVAHYNLGSWLQESGRLNEAITQFKAVLAIDPQNVKTHVRYGNVLLDQGEMDGAIAHLHTALQIKPDDALAHNNLGSVFLRQGDEQQAIRHYEKALAIQPDLALAADNLAGALAKAALRNGDQAIDQAEKANRLAGGRDAYYLQILAAAYGQKGRFSDAIATVQQALRLASTQTNAALADSLRQQLGLYQRGTKFELEVTP